MKSFILSPLARTDLIEIWDYIARDSLQNADKVRDELFATFDILAMMPELGHVRLDITSEAVRFWPVFNYVIVYRHSGRCLEIVTVLHGARDLKAYFGGGKPPRKPPRAP